MKTYAAYSKNEEIRLKSSSGGIFTLLAEQILKEGVVYGVVMSEDCFFAEFKRATTVEELKSMGGSKYFQAKVGDTFKKVKKDIEDGRLVLFTGTSCQINGLKSYLGEHKNLLCVDVICHGVPSPALWKKYAEHKEKEIGGKLIDVNFRCKDDSWTDFGMKEIDEYHQQIYISKDKDPFMQMFLRDYALRPSCYECTAKSNKKSDITIADFWGIESVAPEMNDGKGTSLVLVRTEKGQQFFNRIENDIKSKEVSYEDGVKCNPSEYKSPERPPQRDIFFHDLRTLNFFEMEQKYAAPIPVPLKGKMKQAIKKIILRTPVCKLIRGGFKKVIEDYGVLFTFEK